MTLWVLLTGFGPFSSHASNPSWQAVQAVGDTTIVPGEAGQPHQHIAIVKLNIAVVFKDADRLYEPGRIELLGPGGAPLLIVHVGVHGQSSQIDLEQYARNQTAKIDVEGCGTLEDKCDVTLPKGEKLGTDLDLEAAVQQVKAVHKQQGLREPCLAVSHDAGRFLCNYVYFKGCQWCAACGSGSRNRASGVLPSCVFIHVPVLGKPYTLEKTAEILSQVLVALCRLKLVQD
jgi:pyrrolidone-carboxylate peptidase